MQVIRVHCPACKNEVSFPLDTAGHPTACPRCQVRIPVPVPKHAIRISPRRALMTLAGIFFGLWAVTQFAAILILEHPAQGKAERLDRSFSNTRVQVRAPCPFVMGYRISAENTDKSSMKNYEIAKYYLWVFGWSREIPEKEVPGILKWIWF